jgi:hypothetical protein
MAQICLNSSEQPFASYTITNQCRTSKSGKIPLFRMRHTQGLQNKQEIPLLTTTINFQYKFTKTVSLSYPRFPFQFISTFLTIRTEKADFRLAHTEKGIFSNFFF